MLVVIAVGSPLLPELRCCGHTHQASHPFGMMWAGSVPVPDMPFTCGLEYHVAHGHARSGSSVCAIHLQHFSPAPPRVTGSAPIWARVAFRCQGLGLSLCLGSTAGALSAQHFQDRVGAARLQRGAEPMTLAPSRKHLNPKHSTHNTKPWTLNPKPSTLNQVIDGVIRRTGCEAQ